MKTKQIIIMKTTSIIKVIIIVLFLWNSNTVSAQDKGTSGFSVGFGGATSNSFLNTTTNIFSSILSNNIDYRDGKAIGVFYIKGEYALIDKLMLGYTYGLESIKDDVYLNNVKKGKLTTKYNTISLDLDYHYISKEKFQMYSGFGLAYTFESAKYKGEVISSVGNGKDKYFNFQINALGFRYGKNFGVFAELGYGYKGILNLGLSYQF